MGLKVSASITEAVLFRGPRRKVKNYPVVTVDGEFIQVGTSMKYLGVMLDSRMTFRTHFEYIEGKMSKVSRALGRLMPNLRGPGEVKRRLYANVILSIVLYAAPIWCDALTSARRNREKLDRLMKVMNIRVISAYRTVSLEASSILVRIPPLHLLAATRKRVFIRTTNLRSSGQWTKESANAIREAEALIMFRQWEIHLRKSLLAGVRTRDAILPSLALWLNREHGGISFHATQLSTGHGCFASYLYRIGKVASPVCEHCDSNQEDTAEHTLQVCSAWSENRAALTSAVGVNLDLEIVVRAICECRKSWFAFSRFAKEVMLQKETIEREKEAQEALTRPARRRRRRNRNDDDNASSSQ